MEEMEEAASIHPMCPIDEYARSGRIWVWFNPPSPPTRAFKDPRNKIKEEFTGSLDEIRTNKGIIFCQVVRRRQIGQLIAFIAEGNQKWNGAIPSFTIIPIKIKK